MNSLTTAIEFPGVQFLAGAARIESTVPSGYRLARKQNGELVLQGAFSWNQGSVGGYEWRDIPTVDLGEILK